MHPKRDTERIDEIGFGDLKLIQNTDSFCYGVDAVLLADFAKVKKGGSVVDLGAGNGVVPILLSHKTEAANIVGVEVQMEPYQLALRNVELNRLSHRVKMQQCDVKFISDYFERESFDVVTTNPPYMAKGSGLANQINEKFIARHETTAGIEDFISAAEYLLKDKGSIYMVHRPHRLADIVAGCRRFRLEPKELRFISPRQGEKPNIMLIHCRKNAGSELNVLAPLNVYGEDGGYSEEILKIYEREYTESE